jgi:hypothetical protein
MQTAAVGTARRTKETAMRARFELRIKGWLVRLTTDHCTGTLQIGRFSAFLPAN